MSDKELKENLQNEEKVENSVQELEEENKKLENDTDSKDKSVESETKENDESDIKTKEDNKDSISDDADKVKEEELEEKSIDSSKNLEEDKAQEQELEEDKEKELDLPETPEEKISYARKLVESADSEINDCVKSVKESIEKFKKYEEENLAPIIKESEKVLEKLSINLKNFEALPSVHADFSKVENRIKLYIDDLPSGIFSSLIWGLLGGAVTLGAWYAFIADKLGMPMIPDANVNMETINKILVKIAELTGLGNDVQTGLAVAGGSAFVSFLVVFLIRMNIQKSENEEMATEIAKKAIDYKNEKEQCKLNLTNVNGYLKDLRDIIVKYEVLLNEKNAVINRAILIEDVDTLYDMHPKSKKEVEELMALIKEIDRLIESPILENGEFNEANYQLLKETEELLQKHIDTIYAS